MKKALIIGATKRSGVETARQWLQRGCYGYLGRRVQHKGRQAVANCGPKVTLKQYY